METDRITTKMHGVMDSIRNLRKSEKEEDSQRKKEESRKKEEDAIYKRIPKKIEKFEKDSSRGVDHTDEWGRFRYKREGDQRTVSIKIVSSLSLAMHPAPILTVPGEIRRMYQALCEMTGSNDFGDRMQFKIDNGDTELGTSLCSLTFRDGKNTTSDIEYLKYMAVDKENGDALLSLLKLGKAEFETQVLEAIHKKGLGGEIKLPKKTGDRGPILIETCFTPTSMPALKMTLLFTNKQQLSPSQRDFTLLGPNSDEYVPLTVSNLAVTTELGHSMDLNFVAGLAQIFYKGYGSDEDDRRFYIYGEEMTKPVSISITDSTAKYTIEHGVVKREREYERNRLDGVCSLEITSKVPIKTENVELLLNLLRTPET